MVAVIPDGLNMVANVLATALPPVVPPPGVPPGGGTGLVRVTAFTLPHFDIFSNASVAVYRDLAKL